MHCALSSTLTHPLQCLQSSLTMGVEVYIMINEHHQIVNAFLTCRYTKIWHRLGGHHLSTEISCKMYIVHMFTHT